MTALGIAFTILSAIKQAKVNVCWRRQLISPLYWFSSWPALLAMQFSWIMNNMHKWTNFANSGAKEVKLGSFNGGEDDRPNSIGFASLYVYLRYRMICSMNGAVSWYISTLRWFSDKPVYFPLWVALINNTFNWNSPRQFRRVKQRSTCGCYVVAVYHLD